MNDVIKHDFGKDDRDKSRTAIDVQEKILNVIYDSNLNTAEAIGIIVNLMFVARSYYDKRKASKEEERRAIERHEYEMELLKRKLNEVAE